MKDNKNWKLKIAKIKGDLARNVKQDYLAGFTVPELTVKYGITKRTVYKWIIISEEDKKNHYEQIVKQNKMGRPVSAGKKKKGNKIKDIAKTDY